MNHFSDENELPNKNRTNWINYRLRLLFETIGIRSYHDLARLCGTSYHTARTMFSRKALIKTKFSTFARAWEATSSELEKFKSKMPADDYRYTKRCLKEWGKSMLDSRIDDSRPDRRKDRVTKVQRIWRKNNELQKKTTKQALLKQIREW